jgi:hydrogenase maturation protease
MPSGGSGQAGRRIKVLGVGNLLWADEGFGVRCVEALGAGRAFPEDVELLDGGTLGLALIPLLQDATHLLIFDAVDFGGDPGSLIVARDDELPRFMTRDKMSLHQAGMNDVLAMLAMLGHRPEALTLVGVQPVQLDDYGGSLTPTVQSRVPEAVDLALAELAAWGAEPRAGERPSGAVVIDAVGQARYESGRPPEELACRHGDARFLSKQAARTGPKDPEKPR